MKFKKGDKVKVCSNAGEKTNNFLIHVLEIGKQFEIEKPYTKWKGEDAYILKGTTEILLAGELELIT